VGRVASFEPDHFRQVLGHLPTGVTVVTAHGPDGPVGITANSVTSVSLDPPLILVCVARASLTGQAILDAGRFCVNVIGAGEAETCTRFATRRTDRFDGVPWHERPGGPGLDAAVAWIECEIRDPHDAGDHTIIVAEVTAVDAAEAATPLVFFRGAYGTFGAITQSRRPDLAARR
jgi:flavin reductase (DIM6/NTAB) family NADH-FMN oxidoreductase RutF